MMTLELLKTEKTLAQMRYAEQGLDKGNEVQRGWLLRKIRAERNRVTGDALTGYNVDKPLAQSLSAPFGATIDSIARRNKPFSAGNDRDWTNNDTSRRAQERGILEKAARMRKP